MPTKPEPDVVAARIAEKLRVGALPTTEPGRTWAGKGTGLPCDGCDERIEPGEAEYVVVLRDKTTLSFHDQCAAQWEALRLSSAMRETR
jgi:hypothetical protein